MNEIAANRTTATVIMYIGNQTSPTTMIIEETKKIVKYWIRRTPIFPSCNSASTDESQVVAITAVRYPSETKLSRKEIETTTTIVEATILIKRLFTLTLAIIMMIAEVDPNIRKAQYSLQRIRPVASKPNA